MPKKRREKLSQLDIATRLLDAEAAIMRGRAACLRKDHGGLFDHLMSANAEIHAVLMMLVGVSPSTAEYALAGGNQDAKAERAVTTAASEAK